MGVPLGQESAGQLVPLHVRIVRRTETEGRELSQRLDTSVNVFVVQLDRIQLADGLGFDGLVGSPPDRLACQDAAGLHTRDRVSGNVGLPRWVVGLHGEDVFVEVRVPTQSPQKKVNS